MQGLDIAILMILSRLILQLADDETCIDRNDKIDMTITLLILILMMAFDIAILLVLCGRIWLGGNFISIEHTIDMSVMVIVCRMFGLTNAQHLFFGLCVLSVTSAINKM